MTSPNYGLRAAAYRRYRPSYPEWLFDRAAEACGPPLVHAADLGAGSGQATEQVLRRFQRVTAVEPDAQMAAHIPPAPGLTVQVSPAEQAVFETPLDAAFAATSFHWMDPDKVADLLVRSLRPGGVFLPFGYGPFDVLAPEPVRLLIERETINWRTTMHPVLLDMRPYAEVLTRTGRFASVEALDFPLDIERSPEDAAGFYLTTSYAPAYARTTGDEQGYYDRFTAELLEAAAGRTITIRCSVTAALARV